jgi:enoyl-CoA hydratase/carnithine racemase
MRKIDKTAMTTGHRYGGDEAATVGIADGGAAEDCVVPDTIDKAVELVTKAGLTLKTIKQGLDHAAVVSLTEPTVTASAGGCTDA